MPCGVPGVQKLSQGVYENIDGNWKQYDTASGHGGLQFGTPGPGIMVARNIYIYVYIYNHIQIL